MAASGFTKSQRLRRRGDFDAVQNGANTRKASAPHFLVLLQKRDSGPARLGIIASRRVGSAVCRNRAKRMVREFFREHVAARAGAIDMVVVVKTGAHELSAAEVAGELRSALRKLGVSS